MKTTVTQALLLLSVSTPAANVTSAQLRAASDPRHYIFFGTERDRIKEPSFLQNRNIAGAQLKYSWRELEPKRDRYQLQAVLDDLEFLDRHGKRLFVQLQDVSFSPRVLVPEYLRTDPEFGGGLAAQYEYQGDDEAHARFGGWVARRWDPAVRARFEKLLKVLGDRLDGRIEGLNLPETAVAFGESGRLHPPGFTNAGYVESVKAIMTAARSAFSRSEVIVYANFMPGEWLPWTDHGYLRAIYEHAETIGVGVGGPDLLPHRKGQQNHSYPLIAGRRTGIPAGVAVQDGNLAERDPATGEKVTVQELHAFAREQLRLDYLFWGTQEPYYSEQLLPYLASLPARFHSSQELKPSAPPRLCGRSSGRLTEPERLGRPGCALFQPSRGGILANRAGRDFPCNYVSDGEARRVMLSGGIPDWLAELVLELLAIIRSGAVTEPLKGYEQLTGRKPTPLERFAENNKNALPQFV